MREGAASWDRDNLSDNLAFTAASRFLVASMAISVRHADVPFTSDVERLRLSRPTAMRARPVVHLPPISQSTPHMPGRIAARLYAESELSITGATVMHLMGPHLENWLHFAESRSGGAWCIGSLLFVATQTDKPNFGVSLLIGGGIFLLGAAYLYFGLRQLLGS